MEHKNRKELQDAYKSRTVTGGVYAVRNIQTSKTLVMSTTDLPGAVNRYAFAQQTGGCFHPKLQKDLAQFGKEAFTFETLVELDKKQDQTDADFTAEIRVLEDMMREKFLPLNLY